MEKKMNSDARKAFNATFNICGALIGLVFGIRTRGTGQSHMQPM
jgi:hypothetical protein